MPVLFHTSGALGIHPSKVSSLARFPNFSARMNPLAVSPAFIPPPKRQTGPTGLGFWVRASQGCLVTARRFKPTTTDTFLGFCPCRAYLQKPGPNFSGTPLTCLASPADHSTGQPTPQSLNQPLPCLARPIPGYQPAEATLMGFLHLPAPEH